MSRWETNITCSLDLRSKELLEDALRDYKGTLLFVSHDRYLLKAVPDRIIEIFSDHVEIFKGNYDYYLEKQQEKAALQAAQVPSRVSKDEKAHPVGYRTKQQKAEEAQRRARIRELENRVEELESEIAAVEDSLQHPERFEGGYREMEEECQRLDSLRDELNRRMEEWLELGE